MNITDIQNSVCEGVPIEYSAHCLKRMLERDISTTDINNCIFHGEIIEEYPLKDGNFSDKSLPSCLILGNKKDSDQKYTLLSGITERKYLLFLRVFQSPKSGVKIIKPGGSHMCNTCFSDSKIKTKTAFTVEYNDCLIIVKNVPCLECPVCGEITFEDTVSKRLEELVNRAKKVMQEISIIDYNRAA